MSPETLFPIANATALLGWLMLLAAPWLPRLADRVAGHFIPGVLAAVYLVALVLWMPGAEGGFGSLSAVVAGFAVPGVAMTGWLHYLAVDLFIGGWQVRTAREDGIGHVWVVPCLVVTLLAAPVGLVLFLGLRAWKHRRPDEPTRA